MSEFVLICPKCDSTNVKPVNGTYMLHKCECGYTGDGSQFHHAGGESVLLDDPLAEFFMHEEDEEGAEVVAWLP